MRAVSDVVVLGLLSAALAGCGGGGGGGPRPTAPVVVEEPADQAVVEGAPASFMVSWTGEVTSVRWQRNGVDLAAESDFYGIAAGTSQGRDASSLDVSPPPAEWSGSTFRAVLTGPGGTVTTREASLLVEPASQAVFSGDFDGAIAPELDPGAAGALDGVQGYAGLGPEGNRFGGQFLRSPTGNVVAFSLDGLPEHQSLDLRFLFAAIDSLDGTGAFPAGDFFRVDVDGATVFRESFANATDSQVQSYVPPPGVELARKVDLGFQGPGGFYRDSAYDLGADPTFSRLPHTASSVRIEFVLEGPGVQAVTDESWAIDNLKVILNR